MAENMQADDVQSRQAGFVRYCLDNTEKGALHMKKMLSALFTCCMASAVLLTPLSGLHAAAITEKTLGDTSLDGSISIYDGSLILKMYAYHASGMETGLSEEQYDRADTDRDGQLTLTDATLLLTFYAQTSAGMNPSWGIEEEEIPSAPDVTVSLSGINSPYAVLIDSASGEVIAEKNPDSMIYPASMTKLMTAILTIEHYPNLDTYITVPSAALQSAWNQGGSTAGFSAGAYITVRDLVYGMLLPSGCECTITAALLISGSESAFAEKMNQKAAELGMNGTHYANSSGLPDGNHYTTARDMTTLLRYATQNDTFRQIDTSRNYTTTNGLYFSSTLFRPLLNTYGTTAVTGGNILGGKTGSTSAAGICLTSFAEICGREYILCTAKAPYSGQHIQDARTIYNRLGAALSST